MYSNNDFRSYSENHLQHANKYGPIINGKNSSEYNHNYYLANLWRWGVKGAEAVKDAGQKLLDKTDLDERAAEAIKNTKTNIKNKIKSTNTQLDDKALDLYRNSKRRVNNALKNTGAKEASDYARAKAAYEKNRNASTANELNRARKAYANTAMGKADRAVSNVGPTYNQAARATAQARKAGNTVRTTAGNAVSAVKNAPGNAVKATKGAVKDAIKRTNTQADDQLLEAYRYARSGNKEAAVNSLKNAGGVAKNNLKNQAGVVKNTVQNYAGLAKNSATRNINSALDKTNVDDYVKGAAKTAAGAVAGAAKSAKDYVEDKSGLTARREAKAAWDKFSNTAKDETRASNAWDRAQAAARKNAKAGNDKNAEYYDRVADSKYATMKNLQRRRDTENAEYIRKSDAYDKTPLGRLESIADSIYSGAKDLKDNATRSAANALDRTNEQRGIGTQSGRDNGTLTPHQKNRQDNGIPQWFENYAKSVGGNAKRASKEIQKYLKEVQKHGADSRQAQKARADAMSAVTSALESNRNVSDSGTRSSYNNTAKQNRYSNIQNSYGPGSQRRSSNQNDTSNRNTGSRTTYSEGGKRLQTNHKNADYVRDASLGTPGTLSTKRSVINDNERRLRDERDTINNVTETVEDFLEGLVRNTPIGRVYTAGERAVKKNKKR